MTDINNNTHKYHLCNSIFNHNMVKDKDGTYALSGDIAYEHIYECPYITLKNKYRLPDPVYRKEIILPPLVPFGKTKMWSRLKGLVPAHLTKIKNAMTVFYGACLEAQMMVSVDGGLCPNEDIEWTVDPSGLDVQFSMSLNSITHLTSQETQDFPRLHLLTKIFDAAMIYIHNQNIRPVVYEQQQHPVIRYEPILHYADIMDALMHDKREIHILLSHVMTEIVKSMNLMNAAPRLAYWTSMVLFGSCNKNKDPRYSTVFFDVDYFFRMHDMILHRDLYLVEEGDGGDVVCVPDDANPVHRAQMEYLMSNLFVRMKSSDRFLIPEKTKRVLQSLGWAAGRREDERGAPILRIEASLLDGSTASLFESIWDFAWKIHFDDREMTGEEFKKYTKDKAVANSPAVKKVLRQISSPPMPNHQDLMRGFLQQNIVVRQGGKEFLENLNRKTDFEVPSSLMKGTLKDYQLTGFRWILSNLINCFGAVLADEMGLGKTIQAISVICYMLEHKNVNRILVLSPAISVTNWEREFKKFAPSVRLLLMAPDAIWVDNHQVLITSYEMYLHRKEDIGDDYQLLILDEAQKIKNSTTKTWSALQTFGGRYRLALTGTPLENQVMDIWSLFQTVLPGLLGPAGEFKALYTENPECPADNEMKNKRLRKCIDPFILRRIKSDLSDEVVIPNKHEEVIKCELTPMQKDMYTAYLTNNGAITTANKNSMTSTFRIITHLKMICNHPASFEKQSPLDGVSEKWEFTHKTIADMLNEDSCAKMIIFTQFIEMGNLLVRLIRERNGVPCHFLHGSDSPTTRQRKIDDFQRTDGGNPVLVVSLRAGGCAINLTRATRVIIYDLWWNPAVIAQAVDRAHRIGQTRELTVYKLVTQGTVEQKIYDTLVRKMGISDSIIQANEKWLSSMSEKEIRELLRLES